MLCPETPPTPASLYIYRYIGIVRQIEAESCLCRMAARAVPHRHFAAVPSDAKRGESSDPAAILEAREQDIREKIVHLGSTKLARNRLVECYRREGVNHQRNCKQEVAEYLGKLKTFSGFQG